MTPADITELFYLTPISNLASIFSRGILSHHRAAKVRGAKSIADPNVQDIRSTKVVPRGRPLWDYANLYINVRNPMMFVRRFEQVCVVRVDRSVLNLPDVVVTDRNAAARAARFAPAPGGLSIVDQNLTLALSWKHPDDLMREWDHKARMCAEVLIPDVVDAQAILGVYVANETRVAAVQNQCGRLPTIKGSMFFS